MPIINLVYEAPEPKVGIYHNATLGLISLSSDGSNRITIADKNLGATTVFEVGSGSGTNGGTTVTEAEAERTDEQP